MDDRFFRDAMGKFATGITVITAEVKGTTHGMTANAFVSVSLNPKLILVSIDKRAKMLGYLQETNRFAVSFLASEQKKESMRFAGQKRDEEPYIFERFSELPVIKDALATVVCTVINEVEAGDHVLFIGEVQDLQVKDGEPLIYFKGNYRELKDLN
ncbi:flavin reductase family protein [Neobacillus niacini]|uniref:flavin reductase family protein n=1 Tax=Neobacillus niacini TaxID=86668 RepID=UPI00285B00FF|nr:flavin reductase family protein [Neobacillus niacini]MDR7000286.1 flavin reductase (DIM6/NTAB) family NADH-FMN oxidoreductase RutF [Neobacillus niacini]